MMACKVLDSIFCGDAMPLYNEGRMHRDWTYIADVVSGILAAADRRLGYEIINLGRGEPVLLAEFVGMLEATAGRKAHLIAAPMMEADMLYTYADLSKARRLLGYNPVVTLGEGVSRLWYWYHDRVLRPSC